MTKFNKKIIVLLLTLALINVVCKSTSNKNPLTSVKVGMMFVPNVQFAPFYVAIDKGYYRDAGLDVTLDFSSQADAVQLLGLGRFDFVVGDGEQVIIARDKGLPVVNVMNMYARYPLGIASLPETKIELPQDLQSKRIGIPEYYGASFIGLKAFLQTCGLGDSDVDIIAIGYTQAVSLSQKRLDAAVVYLNNTPVQFQASGDSLRVIPFYKYVSLVSAGLLTNDKTVENKPEVVQRFVAATLEAMEFVEKFPDDALDICLQHIQEGKATRLTQRLVLEATIKLYRSDYTKLHGLGMSDPDAWQQTQQVLQSLGIVSKNLDIHSCYTNHFVTSAISE
ncbi:ABC transporter substrate-binding protein [candidate division KSB1 bacterium]|nr:ABC transporter substrate-binding protein [candidate division KSB1 bacterium]